MTNGDRLRQMSDEELLEFFFGAEAYTVSMPIEVTQVVNGMTVTQTTTMRFLDWMKMETERSSNERNT